MRRPDRQWKGPAIGTNRRYEATDPKFPIDPKISSALGPLLDLAAVEDAAKALDAFVQSKEGRALYESYRVYLKFNE